MGRTIGLLRRQALADEPTSSRIRCLTASAVHRPRIPALALHRSHSAAGRLLPRHAVLAPLTNPLSTRSLQVSARRWQSHKPRVKHFYLRPKCQGSRPGARCQRLSRLSTTRGTSSRGQPLHCRFALYLAIRLPWMQPRWLSCVLPPSMRMMRRASGSSRTCFSKTSKIWRKWRRVVSYPFRPSTSRRRMSVCSPIWFEQLLPITAYTRPRPQPLRRDGAL